VIPRLFLSLCCTALLHAEFRAGAAKTVLTPNLKVYGPVYMAGFGNNRVATAVHDDLYARCVAFSAGQRPAVVCEADLIGLFLEDTNRVRAAIRAKFADANVVVASTHDHEGPDTMGQWGASEMKSGLNEAYNTFVVERITAAATEALSSMQPAMPFLAEVESPELHGFIADSRPPVVHDAKLIVLSLRDSSGKTIATVVNWANHPESLGSKNTKITADYPHALCAHLEQKLGGVGILWNGAVGGMQSPLEAPIKGAAPETFEVADLIGRRVGELAAEGAAKSERVSIDGIEFREELIQIPLANQNFVAAGKLNLFSGRKPLNPDGSTTAPVGALRFLHAGRPVLEVALIPGEMYPELSVGGIERYSGADFPDAPLEKPIKTLMTAKYRMLIGLANDEIGYIIPKAEWDEKPPYLNGASKRWYGEVNSVGPEVAPAIARAFAELMR
jgi:hypothetical protein